MLWNTILSAAWVLISALWVWIAILRSQYGLPGVGDAVFLATFALVIAIGRIEVAALRQAERGEA